MTFNIKLAKQVASKHCHNQDSEKGLIQSFSVICSFLADNPDRLSWRSRNNIPSINTEDGLEMLAQRYFSAYRKSDFPTEPATIPDEIVSIVMQEAYGYNVEQSEQIKIEHQHSMSAENCVGALLERYLDSVLRSHNWHWCCGDFVKAIDFISKTDDGSWLIWQIKNRDNSENSSSSAIRNGTEIQKWFRSFSRRGGTNWENLPELMQGYELSEERFIAFVINYLKKNKR